MVTTRTTLNKSLLVDMNKTLMHRLSLLLKSSIIPCQLHFALKCTVSFGTLSALNLASVNGNVMQSSSFPTGKNKSVSIIALLTNIHALMILLHTNSQLLTRVQWWNSVTSNLLLTRFIKTAVKSKVMMPTSD